MTKSRKKTKDSYMERDFTCGTIRIYEAEKGRNDYGTISLDCGFVIRILIIESKKGRFISYPSYKNKNKEYVNQVFCFDKKIIKELNEIINEIYDD